MHASLEEIRPYREHGLLFGGGLAAGLLLFVLWWAMQPSADKARTQVGPASAAGDVRKPRLDANGVLGDFAGARESGSSVVELEQAPDQETIEANDNSDGQAGGDDAAPPGGQAMTDEEAISGGLLGPGGPPGLQTWYVEVARGPGVSELLEVQAPSADEAMAVLRDFRGNPRVLRGPSARPLP